MAQSGKRQLIKTKKDIFTNRGPLKKDDQWFAFEPSVSVPTGPSLPTEIIKAGMPPKNKMRATKKLYVLRRSIAKRPKAAYKN